MNIILYSSILNLTAEASLLILSFDDITAHSHEITTMLNNF